MAMKVQEIARDIGWGLSLLAIVILVFSFSYGGKSEKLLERYFLERSYWDLFNARRLLEHCSDMNARNEFGETVLMDAVREGNVMMVNLLLEKGVDINIRNNKGKTALGIANDRRCSLNIEFFKERIRQPYYSFKESISNFYYEYLNVYAKRKRFCIEYIPNYLVELQYRNLLIIEMLKAAKQGESLWKIEEQQMARLSLSVSNQCFDIDPVDIKIFIDNKKVVSKKFYVRSQHNYEEFQFNLAVGLHSIRAESIKGGVILEKEFEIQDNLWVGIDYWYYPKARGGHGTAPKHFSFIVSKKPFYYD
ncbi:MAG: ankyrin repeat domain-containing protein [Candidatus Omnitrophota bacterium]|jgi:hypothetical protein